MSRTTQQWLGVGLIVLVAGVMAYRHWTYPPAVEFDNLKYIQLLSTAVSSRNSDWVEKVAEAVAARQADGQMSVGERRHFDRLIELARAEDWEVADRACFAFAEAQLSRRRTRPAERHAHDHKHHHAGADRSPASVASSTR
jgi:hypothetical protein